MTAPEEYMRVCAIDVGSNSIRLLVADVQGDTLTTVSRAGEACRLGRGLDRTGLVDPQVAGRAVLLVSEFCRRARSLGAVRVVVAATAALRSAHNGREVADRIGLACGEPVRILSGDQEAQLVYRSVVLGLGAAARRSSCVVFDLGGGSTEVVSGMGENAGRWTSLPFGAVSLTEKHLHSNPPDPAEVVDLSADVEAILMHECALFPESTPVLAGVGGTVTALASMDRGLSAYQPGLIQGWMVEGSRLESLIDRIVASSEAERQTWTVMGRGRSDIVVAGALVVRQIARRFRARGLMVSTEGLRYGLARLAAKEARADRPG